MKRILCAGLAWAALIFIAGCQSTTSSVAVNANVSEQGSLEKMKTYLANAGQKMDEMAVAEAITQYVAVLAVRDELTRPSQEALDLAAKNRSRLFSAGGNGMAQCRCRPDGGEHHRLFPGGHSEPQGDALL
jgi:hypothetical protein